MTTKIELWDGRVVQRLGVGTWAIGGASYWDGQLRTYGNVDDERSLQGLRLAYDLGVRVFDTAAAYGAGNAELLLGRALASKPDAVFITKCGYFGDPETRQIAPEDVSPAGIRASAENSRKRLGRDRIDLFLLHINMLQLEDARPVFDTMQALRDEGIIGAFGWSTDDAERAGAFAHLDGFVAVENVCNLLDRAEPLMDTASRNKLISFATLPLAMGLLTGKYADGRSLPEHDYRGGQVDWVKFFRDGRANPEFAEKLAAIQDLLRTYGRSLAQGALCWLLARYPHAIPIPGFTSPEQVEENIAALEFGPLPQGVMDEIDEVLQV